MILAPLAIAHRQLMDFASAVFLTATARKPKKWPSSAFLIVDLA
jgi:hypothetical protein